MNSRHAPPGGCARRAPRLLSLAACAVTLLAGGRNAATQDQQPPAEPLPSSGFVQHGLCEADGRVVGIGPGYRLEFVRDGFRYVPALGRQAPRTLPLELQLRSAGRDGSVRQEVWRHAEHRIRRGNRMDRQLTDDLWERLEARPDGVELTYLLQRRPAGTGDFVVALEATTELTYRGPHDRGGIAFDGGPAQVRIGAVTGIDALGRTVPGSLSFEDDMLRLALPGGFLDTAAYPVVLDPIVTTEWTGGPTNLARHPDSALDDGARITARRVFVWAEEFSATHSEIRGVSGPTPFVVRSRTDRFATAPKVAYVRGRDRMVIAWVEGLSALGSWAIAVAGLDVHAARVSPARLTGQGIPEFPGIDLAGSRNSTPYAVLAKELPGNGIALQRITPDRSNNLPTVDTARILIPQSGSTRRVTPSLSRALGTNGLLMLAWRDAPVGATGSVSTQLLGNGGYALVGPRFQLGVGGYEPDVDGDGTNFVVGWERLRAGTSGPRDVVCRMLRWTGASWLDRGTATDFASDLASDEREVSVGYEPEGFMLAWSHDATSGAFLNRDISATVLRSDLCIRCRSVVTAEDRGRDGAPLVLTNWASGFDPGTASIDRIAHIGQDLTVPFRARLWAGPFGFRGPSGTVRKSGDSVGPNGGSLFPGTNALFPTRMPGLVIGSAPFQFALRGARPNQPTIFRIAFPGGPGGGGGLCDLTRRIIASPFDIPGFTSASGGASVTIPIPCDPQLIGELFYGQWITVNPGIPLSCPFPGLSGLEIAASTVVQYEIGG